MQYRDNWGADDPDANFKAEVACYTAADPMPALRQLGANTGIPIECLIRYVLVRWTGSGADARLAMGPVVFEQMKDQIARAENEGTEAARLRAYAALKKIIEWLALSDSDRPVDHHQVQDKTDQNEN